MLALPALNIQQLSKWICHPSSVWSVDEFCYCFSKGFAMVPQCFLVPCPAYASLFCTSFATLYIQIHYLSSQTGWGFDSSTCSSSYLSFTWKEGMLYMGVE